MQLILGTDNLPVTRSRLTALSFDAILQMETERVPKLQLLIDFDNQGVACGC